MSLQSNEMVMFIYVDKKDTFIRLGVKDFNKIVVYEDGTPDKKLWADMKKWILTGKSVNEYKDKKGKIVKEVEPVERLTYKGYQFLINEIIVKIMGVRKIIYILYGIGLEETVVNSDDFKAYIKKNLNKVIKLELCD